MKLNTVKRFAYAPLLAIVCLCVAGALFGTSETAGVILSAALFVFGVILIDRRRRTFSNYR